MDIEHYRLRAQGGFLLLFDISRENTAKQVEVAEDLRQLGRVVEHSPNCYHWMPNAAGSIEKLSRIIPPLGDNELLVCVPLEEEHLVHFFVPPADFRSCCLRVEGAE